MNTFSLLISATAASLVSDSILEHATLGASKLFSIKDKVKTITQLNGWNSQFSTPSTNWGQPSSGWGSQTTASASAIDLDHDILAGPYGHALGNSTYSFHSNRGVSVQVTENPTTGYTWSVLSNDCGSKFTSLGDEYINLETFMVGAGGYRMFNFMTSDSGANFTAGVGCDVTFEEKRSWETDANAADTKTITIEIN